MSIDPNSSVPIYHQIADDIRRQVAAGVYRPGEMIPSLRVLALRLTVNPNTVQRAYEQLERDGLVHARKGLGMFVTQQGVESAQNKSAQALYDTFANGVRAGRAANMPAERIRTAFDKAFDDVGAEARSQT